MKQLILTAGIFYSLSALSQLPKNNNYKFHYNYRLNAPMVLVPDSLKNKRFLPNSIHTPAPGIYQMPQDRMPCIVPDTKELAPMPNAWKAPITIPYSGNIPNPAVPKTFSFRNRKSG